MGLGMMGPTTDGPDIAAFVIDLAEQIFTGVDELRTIVERQLAVPAPRRSDLAIEDHCRELLADREHAAAGAGLVMAPDVLADAPYWLEWWLGDPTAAVPAARRLAAETDPRVAGFRDYTQLPWYAIPRRTDARHITGPYVDYLCTDQQTLTFTAPVRRYGTFAGVVGMDLLVQTVEERAFGPLSRAASPSVLINRTGRVVTASDLSWVTGDLIRDWSAGWELTPCADLPLAVLTRR